MHPKHQKAVTLRLEGKSYREVAKELKISKSLLSRWFRGLELPLSAQAILEEKGRASREYLVELNRRRSELVQAENSRIRSEALKEIDSLSRYELLLIGAALYWGEGYKSERSNKGCVQISNSDPYLIALFLRFLREIIRVEDERLKVSIRIHQNISAQSAIEFWSRITNIPQKRFRITRQISRASKKKRPANSLPHGTLDLRVNRRQEFFRIKGWIDGLKKQSGLN